MSGIATWQFVEAIRGTKDTPEDSAEPAYLTLAVRLGGENHRLASAT
jgi:hypothetical protein